MRAVANPDLFGYVPPAAIKTEGIKYAGSKLKILPYLLELVKKAAPQTVLDGFSGSTRVSQALSAAGYSVHANDIAEWSEVFAHCYLCSRQSSDKYERIIDHLNRVSPIDGWFTQHYGGRVAEHGLSVGKDGLKKPWQAHNTRKLDGIRNEIDRLGLTDDEKAVALTSLILALDKVDSTLGHYVSYLQEWSPRSYKDLVLSLPAIRQSPLRHEVSRRDAIELACTADVDLAYFDPPYGSNNEKMPPSRVRYASYYHIWKTICLNDRPELFGKVARRADTSDTVAPSVFEDYRRGSSGRFVVVEAIDELIQNTKAPSIILSYSSGGRATAEELHEVISKHGSLLEVIEIDYRRNVMANMRWTRDWIKDAEEPYREFLFLMKKR